MFCAICAGVFFRTSLRIGWTALQGKTVDPSRIYEPRGILRQLTMTFAQRRLLTRFSDCIDAISYVSVRLS